MHYLHILYTFFFHHFKYLLGNFNAVNSSYQVAIIAAGVLLDRGKWSTKGIGIESLKWEVRNHYLSTSGT